MDPLVKQANDNMAPAGGAEPVQPLQPLRPLQHLQPLQPVQSAELAQPLTPTMPLTSAPEAPTMPLPEAPNLSQDLTAVGVGFNAGNGGLAETAPLTLPEAPKAPDPVEEELKAPLTPAAPVPGSIGSSISGPAVAGTTPSVAFNDPAEQNMMAENAEKKPAKKKLASGKMNKTTLILLCIVGGMVIIALTAVLIGMAQGWF